MANNVFVLQEEVIDVFNNKFYITTIENCHLVLFKLGLMVQCYMEILEMIFYDNSSKTIKC